MTDADDLRDLAARPFSGLVHKAVVITPDFARRLAVVLSEATPSSEPALNVERLEKAFVHVIDRRPTKVEVTYFYGGTIPVEHQRAAFLRDVIAEYRRLAASQPPEPDIQ